MAVPERRLIVTLLGIGRSLVSLPWLFRTIPNELMFRDPLRAVPGRSHRRPVLRPEGWSLCGDPCAWSRRGFMAC